MKALQVSICIFFFAFLFNNCKEETIGQYPIDKIAPNPVKNIIVNNLPGSVKLSYDLPNDEDLLYIKAEYGENKTLKTSVFNNTMHIKGFGKSKKQAIQLISVDRSQNESTPVIVEIEPFDSPIFEILQNIEILVSFGGFKLNWINPLNENIILQIVRKNSTNGEINFLENFYSSVSNAQESVRGLDSTLTTFGYFIKDVYGNQTDTLFFEAKPLFEQQIPKSGFRDFPISSWFGIHTFGAGTNTMEQLWNDIVNIYGMNFYIKAGNLKDIMPFFTFDMGVKAKLSRFKMWQREDFLFALHNPYIFEWWGTNDFSVANDSETENWEENPQWIKIERFQSRKPSGGGPNDPVTAEDTEYGLAGEDFEFVGTDHPAVRYLRFKLIETWSKSTGCHIGELTFWGEIEN